jgi:hypothetical protein
MWDCPALARLAFARKGLRRIQNATAQLEMVVLGSKEANAGDLGDLFLAQSPCIIVHIFGSPRRF